jgi:hypothetical protein
VQIVMISLLVEDVKNEYLGVSTDIRNVPILTTLEMSPFRSK